jgi:hypothetical protein
VKIRIASDGTGFGTRVYDADSGEELKNVAAVQIDVQASGLVNAHLHLINVPLDLTATVVAKSYGRMR